MELLSLRLKSYGWSVLSFAVAGGIAFFMSDEFSVFINEYTGSTIASTLILLVIPEIAKHLRNKYQLGKARKLGARDSVESVQLI